MNANTTLQPVDSTELMVVEGGRRHCCGGGGFGRGLMGMFRSLVMNVFNISFIFGNTQIGGTNVIGSQQG